MRLAACRHLHPCSNVHLPGSKVIDSSHLAYNWLAGGKPPELLHLATWPGSRLPASSTNRWQMLSAWRQRLRCWTSSSSRQNYRRKGLPTLIRMLPASSVLNQSSPPFLTYPRHRIQHAILLDIPYNPRSLHCAGRSSYLHISCTLHDPLGHRGGP
jgi:hypothetical protein